VRRVSTDVSEEPTADINGIDERNVGITCLTHTAYAFILTTMRTSNLREKLAHLGGEISFPKLVLWSACI